MEKKREIKDINIEQVIKTFKEEEGIDLTIEEAKHIVSFLSMLLKITLKHFLDE